MKRVLTFNKHQFINENYGSEFSQMQFNVQPMGLGPGYGFAVDNQISIYSDADSPYVDQYHRTPWMTNKLLNITKDLRANGSFYAATKFDHFIEDLENYNDFKILRISPNHSLTLDIYISFTLEDEEFFGVFKKFNWIQKPELLSDLFTDSRFTYIDNRYRLKLSNYFYKVLVKWFIPKLGEYMTLKDVPVNNEMGEVKQIPKDNKIIVSAHTEDKDGTPYITVVYRDEKYFINKNDYYFFNYWCEKIEK